MCLEELHKKKLLQELEVRASGGIQETTDKGGRETLRDPGGEHELTDPGAQ